LHNNYRPIAGLILHSGILSGIRVLTTSRALWCFDIYTNVNKVPNVNCPVFVIHGKDDVEVGIHHGEGLHNAVPPACQTDPWFVPLRGHNNVLQGNEREFFSRMAAFLENVNNHQTEERSNSLELILV